MGVTKKVQEGKRLERVQATREPGKPGQVILREKYRCHGRKCVHRYTGTAGQGGLETGKLGKQNFKNTERNLSKHV